MAMNMLMGGKGSGHGGSGGSGGGNPLGGLAAQFLGGGSHGGGSGGQGGSGGGKDSIAGKLVGQLASNLFSPSGSKPSQSQGYHGASSGGSGSHQSGGLAGVMGGVASMFGEKPGHGVSNHNVLMFMEWA